MYPNLKLQLFKSGMRQNQFARMLNIHETMLSKIVNGFREPEPELRARIAALLGTEEQWLFAAINKIGNTPRERERF